MTQNNHAGPVRVVVVDDDALVREMLSSVLGQDSGIEVIATAANGAEAVDLVHERTVDVVLMDIRMPVLDGIEATSRILIVSERTRVLLLTAFDDDASLDGGIVAGASGYLLKTTSPAEIARAVRTIHLGGKVLSPGPTSRVLDRYVRGLRPDVGSTGPVADLDLSGREREVLHLLCQARTNYQIAHRLNVAETTVKTHVASIMRKMGVESRLEVVVEAHRRGIGG